MPTHFIPLPLSAARATEDKKKPEQEAVPFKVGSTVGQPLATVHLTPPEATATGDANASGDMPPATVDPLQSSATGTAAATANAGLGLNFGRSFGGPDGARPDGAGPDGGWAPQTPEPVTGRLDVTEQNDTLVATATVVPIPSRVVDGVGTATAKVTVRGAGKAVRKKPARRRPSKKALTTQQTEIVRDIDAVLSRVIADAGEEMGADDLAVAALRRQRLLMQEQLRLNKINLEMMKVRHAKYREIISTSDKLMAFVTKHYPLLLTLLAAILVWK